MQKMIKFLISSEIKHIDFETTVRAQMLSIVALMSLLFSICYFFIFYTQNLTKDAYVMLSFVLIFSTIIFTNHKGNFSDAKIGYLLSSNLGLLYFSISLGFDSGIHLFTFLSPIFAFSIYPLKEIKQIIFCIFTYIVNYYIMYSFSNKNLFYTSTVIFTMSLQTVIIYFVKNRLEIKINKLRNEIIKQKELNHFLNHELTNILSNLNGLIKSNKENDEDSINKYMNESCKEIDIKIEKLIDLLNTKPLNEN